MEKDRSYYDIQRNQSPPRGIKYFNLSEFDSPDDIGSGENMDINFVRKLDEAREIAGIPFKVNSGYRTPFHNTMVNGVKSSSHMNIPCNAVDIRVESSSDRFLIISAAIQVGINRIGIGKNFVHLDADKTKSQDVTWHYY